MICENCGYSYIHPSSTNYFSPKRFIRLSDNKILKIKECCENCFISIHNDYVAISHTSATGKDDDLMISFGDLPWKVPEGTNRHVELFQKLLVRSGFEYAWMDSLCINQDSNEEKAQEIPKMSYIYEKAKLVFVTMPDLDPMSIKEVKDLCNTVKNIYEETGDQLFGMETVQTNGERGLYYKIIRRPLQGHDDALAYFAQHAISCSFLKHRWFSRVWTLQEALLANEVIWYNGTETIILKKDFSFLFYTHKPDGTPIYDTFYQTPTNFSVLISSKKWWDSYVKSGIVRRENVPYSKWLALTTIRNCKFKHDMIYGLLGIKPCPDLSITYNELPDETAKRFMSAWGLIYNDWSWLAWGGKGMGFFPSLNGESMTHWENVVKVNDQEDVMVIDESKVIVNVKIVGKIKRVITPSCDTSMHWSTTSFMISLLAEFSQCEDYFSKTQILEALMSNELIKEMGSDELLDILVYGPNQDKYIDPDKLDKCKTEALKIIPWLRDCTLTGQTHFVVIQREDKTLIISFVVGNPPNIEDTFVTLNIRPCSLPKSRISLTLKASIGEKNVWKRTSCGCLINSEENLPFETIICL